MKIRRLRIENFKGIQAVDMPDLDDVVIIAGKNGCGKTCILEGIRLLKSHYGHYSENENRAWWDEKQVDLSQAGATRNVLRDKQQRAVVEVEIELTPEEKEYIKEDPNHLTEVMAIRTIAPGIENRFEFRLRNWSLQNWRSIPELATRATEIVETSYRFKSEILRELSSRLTIGRFDIRPDGNFETRMNPLLNFVFSTFEPRHLGIIEFNPAERRYPPERFTNVTVDVEAQDEAWKQSAMYNTEGKYGGVKGALGNEWIRGIIRKEAGEIATSTQVAIAMREIFKDLIPDKTFDGPRPTLEGRLEFNVTTGGSEHDIDDLSSGEKEILFGYLKIRARAPKNSVIIVDEPELHMNPRMIAGLPNLYEKHIGNALQNQVWLVTHSDMFLRRAFESGKMQVFHMDMPKDEDRTFNQMKHVGNDQSYERACLELIGDFATYEPQGTTILMEGAAKFDEQVVSRLFPKELRGVNILSVAGKNEVINKRKELLELQEIQGIAKKVISITDGDGALKEKRTEEEKEGVFRWDLYDIESYLLDPKYIILAVEQISLRRTGEIPLERIESLLQSCAQEVMQEMVSSQLVDYVRNKLKRKINQVVKRPGKKGEISVEDVVTLVEASKQAATAVHQAAHEVSKAELCEEFQRLKAISQSEQIWESDGWKKIVPGKRVLLKVADTLVGKRSRTYLRSAIIGLMAIDGHKPVGMKETINRALAYNKSVPSNATDC